MTERRYLPSDVLTADYYEAIARAHATDNFQLYESLGRKLDRLKAIAPDFETAFDAWLEANSKLYPPAVIQGFIEFIEQNKGEAPV